MTELETALAAAFDLFSRGEVAAAAERAAPWARSHGNDPRVAALLGQIHLAQGRPADAVAPLQRAVAAAPQHPGLLAKLAFALIGVERLAEARRVAETLPVPQLRRIVAHLDQREGHAAAAIGHYRAVLAEAPGDVDSWYNLGLLLDAQGEPGAAAGAFDRAIALRPDERDYHLARSQALAGAAWHRERRAGMREAAARWPDDPAVLVELGVAEGAADDLPAAEAAYRAALAADPAYLPAYHEFATLLDRTSRLDELATLIEAARQCGLGGGELGFVEALLLKRRGRPVEARAQLELAGDGIDPARRAQLRGEIADALGDVDAAFASFVAMNAATATTPAAAAARAMNYPAEVAAAVAALQPARIARWQPSALAAAATPPTPVFILGFPRSGTTLLDTLLRNLPGYRVLEEPPMIERVADRLAGVDLALLPARVTADARQWYFALAAAFVGEPLDGRTIVDKFPLHMTRAALIHRLFPAAKLVLVERHPCDAVLSCFMARFQPNKAMVQFLDLADAAQLYALAAEAWHRAEALLPLDVHRIRYERLVVDVEATLRPLLGFLGTPWDAAVLDNRAGAAGRLVATASYAQVTEPIHTRSVERWRRYRRHLEPVLPTLAPWVERLGYTL